MKAATILFHYYPRLCLLLFWRKLVNREAKLLQNEQIYELVISSTVISATFVFSFTLGARSRYHEETLYCSDGRENEGIKKLLRRTHKHINAQGTHVLNFQPLSSRLL